MQVDRQRCALQLQGQHTMAASQTLQAGGRVGKAQPFSKVLGAVPGLMHSVLVLSSLGNSASSPWRCAALPPPCTLPCACKPYPHLPPSESTACPLLIECPAPQPNKTFRERIPTQSPCRARSSYACCPSSWQSQFWGHSKVEGGRYRLALGFSMYLGVVLASFHGGWESCLPRRG